MVLSYFLEQHLDISSLLSIRPQWHSSTGLPGHHASLSGQRRQSEEQYFLQASWKDEFVYPKGRESINPASFLSVLYTFQLVLQLDYDAKACIERATYPVSVCTHWCLQKNALQWTKSPTANESGDGTGTTTASTTSTVEGAEQESCDSTETTAASGENDGVWTIDSFHIFFFPRIDSFSLFFQ